MTIDSQNEYASVLVVSLDGEALARSRSVLVQVGTRARPTGWVEREATFKSDDGKQTFHGKQVVSTGAMPWAVEETRIRLTVKNAGAAEGDSAGPERECPRSLEGRARQAARAQIELPRDAMYVVLKADGAVRRCLGTR